MVRRRWHVVVLVAVLATVLAACAAGPNSAVGSDPQSGFLLGLWQGAIAPVTFVVSLFNHDVAIYEVHNAGHWYDFGFLVGVSMTFSGGARSASRSPRGARDSRSRG